MDELNKTDTQQLSQGSTQTDKCAGCDNKVPVSRRNEERLEYKLGGVPRLITFGASTHRLAEYCESCGHQQAISEDIRRQEEKKAKRLAQEEAHLQRCIRVLGGKFVYENFTFESYKPKTKSQEEALLRCQEFSISKESLYISGPPGVGKSHLACAILRFWLDAGISGIERWRITEFFRFLRIQRTPQEEKEIVDHFVNLKIFLLEDLGVQKETDWSSMMLWEIVDRRIEESKHGLIVTSNDGRGALADHMGDRIPSRLSSLCQIIKIDGADHRLT